MNVESNINTKADKVMDALLELGIDAKNRGFMYIAYAEQLILQDRSYMGSITKALYIDIASAFATSPCGVERCIRTSIAGGWKVTPDDVKKKFFGNSIQLGKKVPTNAQFLLVLYYYITLH